MHIYPSHQVESLLRAIAALSASTANTGCDPALTMIDATPFVEIREIADVLQRSAHQLVIGRHEYANGVTTYAYAVPVGAPDFSEEDFEHRLGDLFEPEHEEFATVEVIDAIEWIP